MLILRPLYSTLITRYLIWMFFTMATQSSDVAKNMSYMLKLSPFTTGCTWKPLSASTWVTLSFVVLILFDWNNYVFYDFYFFHDIWFYEMRILACVSCSLLDIYYAWRRWVPCFWSPSDCNSFSTCCSAASRLSPSFIIRILFLVTQLTFIWHLEMTFTALEKPSPSNWTRYNIAHIWTFIFQSGCR